MYLQAAKLLIAVKTRLGRKVPDYARKIVNGVATAGECRRAPTELDQTITQMRNTERQRLFLENVELKQWYDANHEEEEVV